MDEPSIALGPDRDGTRVVVAGGRISSVHAGGDGDDRAATTSDPDHLSCADACIEAGWVNAHTHVYSGLAPLGMPAPDRTPRSFVEILERVWWRLDRALDERTLRASARLYGAEALLAGTTTLIDHHESPEFIEGSLDVLADACEELGLRAVLCYGATERNGGPDEARRGLEECRRFIRSNRRPRIREVIGLHASFTVSDDTIRAAARLCEELDTVLHVHLAEDGADVEDAVSRGHRGPLERLLDLNALPPGSILAHGVHLDGEQVRRARDASLWIVQNPRSNRGNGVGYPPALAESDRVALGTDGYPACRDEERDALLIEAGAHGESPEAASARIEAGRGILQERFGDSFSMDVAAVADVVARGADGARHVLAGGRLVVEEGRLLTADMDRIRAEAEAEALHLWERMVSL
jgi:cytosine/adenosine deaminase-related metal-dependent hydrolase